MKIINYENPQKNIFNFDWEFISDQVMGGVSEGNFNFINVKDDSYYKLSGNVSTKNNGGFIQFRSKLNIDDNSLKKIRFHVRGSGDEYFIHIRTPYTILPWQYYSYSFQTSEEWNVIEIPFSNFEKSHIFQPKKFSSSQIKTIAFVAYGKDFKAELDIKNIELD